MQRLRQIELDSRKDDAKGKRRRVLIGGAIILIIIMAAGVRLLGAGGGAGSLMTAVAQSQPLVSIVVERGALKAAETITYSAPRLRRGGGQTILYMAAEGEVIEKGELVVRFDSSSLEESVRQQQTELDEAEAQLRKTTAQQESQMASLQASLEQAQHSHQQAALRMQALQFESEIRQRQEEYNFKKSELSLERAREAIDTQARLNAASLQHLQLNVERTRRELEEMKAELDLTTLYAEQPGLVIYETTWGPEGQGKLAVGDSPYSGQAVISIPDLSTMTVQVGISELDIRRVAAGQEALVKVDAYPDTVYTAKVTEISPLASRWGRSQIKVFDCVVTIQGTDLSLRPGMTAQVSIITHYEPDVVIVPLEAIFYREGNPVVFTVEGGIEEVEVVLGAENGNYVVVEEGLPIGTMVALRDPFMPLEELETAGVDALLQRREAGGGFGGEIRVIMERIGGGRGGRGSMRIFH